jgi:putrescine transport system permease protein
LADGARFNWGRLFVIGTPYLWLGLFFLVPFVLVLKISLSESILAQPPYGPLWETDSSGHVEVKASAENFSYLVRDPFYKAAYLKALKTAFFSTLIALLIGYPMAYGIARAKQPWRNTLLMLVVLPFWTSFLIRVYAWKVILQGNGPLNAMLLWLGVVDEPVQILYTDFAIYLGIVYSYLPFMVLPLYAAIERLDLTLNEAAANLGAPPWRVFLSITLPLSLPGIIAGCGLVFIPAVGEFVIPEMLGGPNAAMIGRVLWNEFFANRDWPIASAVAVAMLIFLVVPIMLFQRYEARAEGR